MSVEFCLDPEDGHEINSGLQVITVYQGRCISCNQCTCVVLAVDGEGLCACVGRGYARTACTFSLVLLGIGNL